MIDTLRIRTDYLPQSVIDLVKTKMCIRHGIDMNTGEQLYLVVSGSLSKNTHDRKIIINVRDYEWKSVFLKSEMKKVSMTEPCEPYLVIEGSVHKILEKHNLCGGTMDIKQAVTLMINYVAEIYEVEPSLFGSIDECQVLRLDFAKNFRMPRTPKYINMLSTCYYPRRKVVRHSDECIYIKGSTTTFKVYDKHKEFKKHDYKVLQDGDLLELSKDILRVEVEVKKRKLVHLFGDDLKVGNIDMGKIVELYNSENEKIFKSKVVDGKKLVGEEVFDKLCEEYGENQANALYTSYNILCNGGCKALKEKRKHNTYYRHIRMLKELGIYWTDVKHTYSKEVEDFINFIPYTTSKRAIN